MKRRSLMLLAAWLLAACGRLEVQVQWADPAATADTQRLAQSARIMAPCPVDFFFGALPDRCPNAVVRSYEGAFQMFDGGYMLWEGGTRSVYILYNDGFYTSIAGEVIETWPEVSVTELPPPQHFKPMRGFGRVWLHEAQIRERLGWPFGIEQAYRTSFQESSEPGAGRWIYLSLPNSQVIEFTQDGTWQVVG